MCGRYFIKPADTVIREYMDRMNRSPLMAKFRETGGRPLAPEGEILPSDVVPVLATARSGSQAVFPMKWGFRRSSPQGKGAGLLINARTETAAEKPTFRDSWARHRCAVPASGYFEWDHPLSPEGKKKPGQKYAIRPEGDGVVWLAGLYRMEEGLPVFVILTRPAAEGLSWMHDRMPLMLPEASAMEWIRPDADPLALSGQCLTEARWEPAGQAAPLLSAR